MGMDIDTVNCRQYIHKARSIPNIERNGKMSREHSQISVQL